MNKEQFLENLSKIHAIFQEEEKHLNTLSHGIQNTGKEREVLDDLLDTLQLEKNAETYFAAAARIGDKKFEALEMYLKKQGKSQVERDEAFEVSYRYVASYYEHLQGKMLERIQQEQLLPAFYEAIFEYTHTLGKLYSTLFLAWNRKLLFETNRSLEAKFGGDQDAIIAYVEEQNLFDLGHRGEQAERCYSILISDGESYISKSYGEVFPDEVGAIISCYDACIARLQELDDPVYEEKQAYIEYFTAIKEAWQEQDVDQLVAAWSEVDVKWMAIDTPVQPGHPMEYYEDKYRRAVSIEFDLRLLDLSLFTSTVAKDVEQMYEGMYDEIGRENFPESYQYSQKSMKQVQLYISSPVLAYGSFLCGTYSAQVVPNDDVVSSQYGKKIFAFPKYVREAQRSAPKMQLDKEIISEDLLIKYYEFLHGSDENYYTIYDIETIGHEYGHTLWLTPGAEVAMGEKGLFKNIEEFKATAGGLVAYFLKPLPQNLSSSLTPTLSQREREGIAKLNEDIVLTHIMRSIKMMRYREVEDILPYYCECLIHLHILFESRIISYEPSPQSSPKGRGSNRQIQLHYNEQNFMMLKELYIAVYTQQIFTYLHQMEAGNFLFEYVVKENGVFLPKDATVRAFVEEYYEKYKEIGNQVL